MFRPNLFKSLKNSNFAFLYLPFGLFMIISVLIVPKTFLFLLLHCVDHSTKVNIVIILLIPNKIQVIFIY